MQSYQDHVVVGIKILNLCSACTEYVVKHGLAMKVHEMILRRRAYLKRWASGKCSSLPPNALLKHSKSRSAVSLGETTSALVFKHLESGPIWSATHRSVGK